MPIRIATCFAALSIAVFAGGCGTSVGEYCERYILCEEGNDFDVEACEVDLETRAELAELRNCGAEFDEVLECFSEVGRCNDDRWDVDSDDCDAAEERYQRCID